MFVILYKCKCICNYIEEELYLIKSSIVDAQLVLVVMIFIEPVTFHSTISYVYNIDSMLSIDSRYSRKGKQILDLKVLVVFIT